MKKGKEAALLGKREREARANSGTWSYRWGSAIRRESSGSMEIGWWQRGSYRDDVKGGRQPGAGLAWWAGPKGKKGEEEKEGQKASPGPNKNFGIFPIFVN